MAKTGANVFLFVALFAAGGALMATATTDCKQPNDFEYDQCGSGDDMVCCKSREACIEAEQMDKTTYACSEERELSGRKAVFIVIVPMLGFVVALGAVAYLVLKCGIKANHTTKACVAVVAMSWPLFLSQKWYFGYYSVFLAVIVASLNTMEGLPFWVYRLTWFLALFQVVSLFGAYEAMHVPFSSEASVAQSNLITTVNGGEAACSAFYEGFFTLVSIEKTAKEADPDLNYYGLCTMEFLAFVQVSVLFQGLAWMATVVMTVPSLLSKGSGGDDQLPKVDSVMPKTTVGV